MKKLIIMMMLALFTFSVSSLAFAEDDDSGATNGPGAGYSGGDLATNVVSAPGPVVSAPAIAAFAAGSVAGVSGASTAGSSGG